jgi:hypothetical protein
MNTSPRNRDFTIPLRYGWIYLAIVLPFCVFMGIMVSGGIASDRNPSPTPREMEDVKGYLRGGIIVYIRRFEQGSPIEDLFVTETGEVSRGPVAYPPRLPRPTYSQLILQEGLFNELRIQTRQWCDTSDQHSLNRELPYVSVGIQCEGFRITLLQITDNDTPPVIHNILQDTPAP